MTHICVSELTIIGSDNGLSPDRRQAIIWTNAGILSIGPLRTNFSEILIETLTFSSKKMRLKVSSTNWWPFCLGLNKLMNIWYCCISLSKVFPFKYIEGNDIFISDINNIYIDSKTTDSLSKSLFNTHPVMSSDKNGYVVEVATRVVTGGAEACLQRLRSSWRHIRFIDEIAMHSYLLYTVFNTLRPRQDGCLFLQTTFWNSFSWMETPEFQIKFLGNTFLRG